MTAVGLFNVLSFVPFVLLVVFPVVMLLAWSPNVIRAVRYYILIYDGIWYLGMLAFYILWWICGRRGSATSAQSPDIEERKLGSEALRGQINIGIVASSFLVAAATFLFGGPLGAGASMPRNALADIQRAVAWLIVALLIGLWNAFSIARHANRLNVASEPYFNILSVAQLFAMLLGVLSFVSGISWLVEQ